MYMKQMKENHSTYKKMSPKGNTRLQHRKSPSPEKPALKHPTQILIIFLLSLVFLLLAFLVFLFFQPERVQLWQEQFIPKVSEKENQPEVKRLTPEIPAEDINTVEKSNEYEKQSETPQLEHPEKQDVLTRNARLYFVKVNTEGQISLKSIVRTVQYNSSPLTETINTLLKGPSSDEINKGSLTLIPEETRLLSARVENNIAYLNFDESFRFNSLGREGYTAQLKQIVYTATEFSNISSVQIMIEGTIKEYLGGEGIFVGEPLTRETFSTVP